MHAIPLVMPKMSMTMTEGELVAWHVKEGDRVEAGQVVCVVATDKVDMDVEATTGGTISRLVAEPGTVVPVGEPLAHIAGESEDLLAGLLDTPPAPPPAQARPVPGGVVVAEFPAPAPAPEARIPALPGARRRAAHRGLRLAAIPGSGPGGVITIRDVEAAEGRRAARSPAPVDEVSRRRRAVRARRAARLTDSAAVPQFTIWRELDLHQLTRRRGALSWTPLLLRALATALRENPGWAAAGEERPNVVCSLAVDSVHGLLAPSFTDPDLCTAEELQAEVRDVVTRARGGRIGPRHLAPGTVGMANLGPLGAERFTAPVTPPQVAVVTVGAIGERVAVVDGGIRIRTGCTVGLTVDHRVAEGADGARLLASLALVASDPDRLLGAEHGHG